MPSLRKPTLGDALKTVALVVFGTTFIPADASAVDDASHRETMQEREACTPDVLRLCRSLVPDRHAITNCLIANTERLSPACHEVMARR